MITTFKSLVRQNTGSHMCDSGGHYGYNYERPLPKQPVKISYEFSEHHNEFWIYAIISLAEFLKAAFTVDVNLTKALRNIQKQKDVWSYGESADAFAEVLGAKVEGADNSCNWETDLDQNFQFSIIETSYGERLFLVQSHNGCDLRGGYSDILVCRETEEYVWAEPQVGWSCFDAVKDGKELSHEECQAIDERWQIGYANYPTSEMQKDIHAVLSQDGESLRVILKDGTECSIAPNNYRMGI